MIEADAPAFARAIHAAARGEALFTEVRDLASRGLPDKQIAERLHISVKTVEKHVGSALRKTGARNRTELAGMTKWGTP